MIKKSTIFSIDPPLIKHGGIKKVDAIYINSDSYCLHKNK